MNFHIVPLSSPHLERVIEIERLAHQFPWKPSMLQNIQGRGAMNYVAIVDDVIAGYFYAQNIVGEVTLLNIAIDPLYQGNGYGRRLIDFFLTHCEQQQAESAWLEVRESNQAAYSLYLNAGFHEVDRRVGYYPSSQGREDALIMSYFFSV